MLFPLSGDLRPSSTRFTGLFLSLLGFRTEALALFGPLRTSSWELRDPAVV